MAQSVKAITFDLWDTMIADETDEPKRVAQGLDTKTMTRRILVHEALNAHGDAFAFDTVVSAYDVVDAAFDKVWKQQHITWTVRQRLGVLFTGLRRKLPDDAFDTLVAAHERMELEVPPDTVPGIAEALAALDGRYKMCVVSDTIVSPGGVLRELLAHHGIERYFDAFVFSDEVGRAKPDPAMFHAAAERLGVEFGEMLHIGDRDHNDVKGPQALGMKAILFTARRAVDEATTSADAVCRDHAELPAIIDALAAG